MSWDDASEVRQRLEKDPAAVLGEAFSHYRTIFLKLVQFRMDPVLSGRIDAEDVLQEAWVSASNRLSHFVTIPKESTDQNSGTEEMSLFVWLRLIVMQTLVDLQRHHLGAKMRDAYRQRSIHRGSDDPASNLTSISLVQKLVGNWTSPSGAVMREERAIQIRSAVESMDPIDREVLALRHFEELSNSQTAEVLGIKQKAASIRYIRSLRRLKEILNNVDGFGLEN